MKENSELDKITKAKRLIKQQAPAMNKLPQDDPKRKAFIDRVKQINQKYKELLAKQDDKISGIGKDQELDEGNKYLDFTDMATLDNGMLYVDSENMDTGEPTIPGSIVAIDGSLYVVSNIEKGDNYLVVKAPNSASNLEEGFTVVGPDREKNAKELANIAKKLGLTSQIYRSPSGNISDIEIRTADGENIHSSEIPQEFKDAHDRQMDNAPDDGPTVKPGIKLKKLTKGGTTYKVGEDDPNDDGTIISIEKYPNGYFIKGVVYGDDDGDKYEKEGYGYAIDLDGNEMSEEDLEGMFEEGLDAEFAPSPNSDVMDANAEEYDIATAFKKARVDMSKPVMVIHSYGHAYYAKEVKDEMSAEAAVKKLEAERQDRSKEYTDDGREVPEDHHGYEFENYSVLEEQIPEGHEYKFAYAQTGDQTYAITQEKSNKVKEGKYKSDAQRKAIYATKAEKLKESTDLYDRNGIQITRFAGGRGRGLMLQINIGGKHIVVPADEFNNFIRALASIKDDVRDMKLQQPRDRYEQSETK